VRNCLPNQTLNPCAWAARDFKWEVGKNIFRCPRLECDGGRAAERVYNDRGFRSIAFLAGAALSYHHFPTYASNQTAHNNTEWVWTPISRWPPQCQHGSGELPYGTIYGWGEAITFCECSDNSLGTSMKGAKTSHQLRVLLATVNSTSEA